jgi:hypothetical protein
VGEEGQLEEADAVTALLELTRSPPSSEEKDEEAAQAVEEKEEDEDADAIVQDIPDTEDQFQGRAAKIAKLGFDKTSGSIDVRVSGM